MNGTLTAPSFDEMEVNLFGPGYGECLVVHLGQGEWMIVDSCCDSTHSPVAIKYLEGIGVDVSTKVRLIVATHWHDDHIRGISNIFDKATSANLVLSAAMADKHFGELMGIMTGSPYHNNSGVTEWCRVLNIAKSRIGLSQSPRPSTVNGDRRIFNRSQNGSISPCEVWSLSPSDESFALARDQFRTLLPKKGQAPTRLIPIMPNHTSIVLWVIFGNESILLGADLETISSQHSGWNAVVASQNRPQLKAGVFKVPHHGSVNGDHSLVWSNMLVPTPISIISPYLRGVKPLPAADDLARIKSHSSHVYLTAESVLKPSRRKKANGSVNRLMLTQAHNFHPMQMGTGHIRLRKTIGADWGVEVFGSAKKV